LDALESRSLDKSRLISMGSDPKFGINGYRGMIRWFRRDKYPLADSAPEAAYGAA